MNIINKKYHSKSLAERKHDDYVRFDANNQKRLGIFK